MEFRSIKWTEDAYRRFVSYLQENSDEDYLVFNSRIVKNTCPMLGVRMPLLQKAAKEIAKGDPDGYFSLPHGDFFEETMVEGLVIAALQRPYHELAPLIGSFIDKIENWMLCDCFCSALKCVKRFPQEFWEYTALLLVSANPWHIRTGLVLMLNYYLDEAHIEEALSRCDAVTNTHYYVQMAQAWLVSMAYVKFPALTEEYLSRCRLDDFTYNKAISKICESRCVTDEARRHLKTLKRN